MPTTTVTSDSALRLSNEEARERLFKTRAANVARQLLACETELRCCRQQSRRVALQRRMAQLLRRKAEIRRALR